MATNATAQDDGLATSPSDLGHDLTICDREPIHIPGAIQPHGMLLIVDPAEGVIVGGAGDVASLLGADWLGGTILDLIGEAGLAILRSTVAGPVVLGTTGQTTLSVVASREGRFWLIELEPTAPGEPGTDDALTWIEQGGEEFSRAVDLDDLTARAASIFARLTGFDRVMIYRFLDDDSGKVVAERHAPDIHGFLNHHFPASDIPRQARALYIRNRVRVIPDASYTPAPIIGLDPTLSAVDLSNVGVRAVSPIHVQYLRNMAVAASASVSIIKDGMLWGLVACHHRSPRNLSYLQRKTCELIAASLAQQIGAKEEAAEYRERLRLRTAEDALAQRFAQEYDPDQLSALIGSDLQRLLRADGFVLQRGPMRYSSGHVPPPEAISDILQWVRAQGNILLHTAALEHRLPAAHAYRDMASGLLAITLSADEPVVLLWFRAETLQTIQWAGNPHKAVEQEPDRPLTPRASFAAWSEEIRGRALPWSPAEIEAAHRLSRLLFDARQRRRISELNRELTRAVTDKDALLAQQETLIKEVNHRVQNSLQLVVAFLAMQANAENDETLTRHLGEAQRRLSAVALVHRRLYSEDTVTVIDLGRYIEDLLAEMQSSMGDEWTGRLTMDLAPLLISADAAVQVGLVLVELVINAQKYAYGGKPGPIAITLEKVRNRFRLTVADRGQGRTGNRTGFGTRMLGAMVKRLDGTIEESDNAPGLRFTVSAPIATPEDV
ncbi:MULTISPECIES: histidine kinase dimerization/phosphoacceptor domain -containing protein [Sphingomonas]|uniref:histidine kinase dimerization/phosphoacceptor domain -containing protein n=1 Tax=Sphingomonas TaxID=13687 RepID=UPI00234EE314|nr:MULTISPECIES: histidine kinase dimerization/phosphoacceptor domain -containing protein [Sphingomonas]WCP71071.1 histidine kinase dimerization/phosphoacceptor domain -containing protein [Sphingomonas hankookensis]